MVQAILATLSWSSLPPFLVAAKISITALTLAKASWAKAEFRIALSPWYGHERTG
jgi:hypothetical protein